MAVEGSKARPHEPVKLIARATRERQHIADFDEHMVQFFKSHQVRSSQAFSPFWRSRVPADHR
jgi:hypothetical protein